MNYSGARILIECLAEQGVDSVFGYPGGSVIAIYDELHKHADRIKHYLTAHEQGAAHAADGYARATGKPGVVIATSGPGATNLVTGIATAYMDSVPMVAITGNVPVSLLGKDSFQEVDIAGITMPITKHSFIVKDVKDLARCLRSAFAIATTGRKGPVLVDIPKDVTMALCSWEAQSETERAKALAALEARWQPPLGATELADAAAMINASKRPLLYAGGGIISSGAAPELKELAERLKAPVALSLMGHGAFPAAHPLCTGLIGMHGAKASNMAASRADLIIALGTRFSDRVVGNVASFASAAGVLHIDIDPAEINKNIRSGRALKGNIKAILQALVPLVRARDSSDWNGDIDAWKQIRPSSHHADKALHPRFIMEEIHARVPSDAIITTEVGQHQMWTAQFYPFSAPRSFISSGGLGTMGFGTGAAMGAQVAYPARQIVHIAGDGSFRMNCAELATIAHYDLPILIVVMNNGTLGMVRQWQSMFFDGRHSATTLNRPPDFVKLADAFGLAAWRATDASSFKEALALALESRRPCLIECAIDIDESVLPMVPSGKAIEEQILEP